MKKIHFIILTVFAGTVLSASAQNINGGIEASGVKMTKTESSVLLEMELDIHKDAVGKCQSIAVSPALSNGADHADFPYVLVNGKNKRQIFDRQKKFGYTALVQNPPLEVVNIDKKNQGKKINYAAEVPYESWMENASLSIDLVLSSCANELQLYALEVSAVSVVTVVQEAPVRPEPVAVAEAPVVVAEPVKPEPVAVVVEPAKPEPVVVAAVEAPVPDKSGPHVSGCAYLDFETGSSVIVPFYKRNPKELATIHEALDKVKNDPNVEITALTIVGYASPEGRWSTNETLAYDRARSFARYIQNRYGIPVQYSNVRAVAEDWDTLRELVVVSNIPHKSAVLSIIDGRDAPDAKESKLRRLDGGRVWRTMLDEMFPQLRRVEYRVDYKVK